MVSQHFSFVLLLVLFWHQPALAVAALTSAPFDLSQLVTLLVQFVPLPIAFAVAGTSVGRFLAQQHFPKVVNDLIAFLFVLAAAIVDAIVSHQVSATTNAYNIVSVISGIFTLLVAGPLSSLKPYMVWLDFLQNTLFNVVKPTQPIPTAALPSRVSNAYVPSSSAGGPAPLLYPKSRTPNQSPPPSASNTGGADTSG